jgi:hypothetical protein
VVGLTIGAGVGGGVRLDRAVDAGRVGRRFLTGPMKFGEFGALLPATGWEPGSGYLADPAVGASTAGVAVIGGTDRSTGATGIPPVGRVAWATAAAHSSTPNGGVTVCGVTLCGVAVRCVPPVGDVPWLASGLRDGVVDGGAS